jgi:signal peptidase II
MYRRGWWVAFGAALILALDQLTKWLIVARVKSIPTVPLIENVFHFTYSENRGAAFGILQEQLWLFILITLAVFVAAAVFLNRKKPENRTFLWALALVLGGAAGNFADRVFRGYVVDFLDFRLIHFAIFNLADSAVVAGAALLAFYLLFIEGKRNV